MAGSGSGRGSSDSGCVGTLLQSVGGLLAVPLAAYLFVTAEQLRLERDQLVAAPVIDPSAPPAAGGVVRFTGIPTGEFPQESHLHARVLLGDWEKSRYQDVTRTVRKKVGKNRYETHTVTSKEWVTVSRTHALAPTFRIGRIQVESGHPDIQWVTAELQRSEAVDTPARAAGARGSPAGVPEVETVTGIPVDRPVTVIGRLRDGWVRPEPGLAAVVSIRDPDLTLGEVGDRYPSPESATPRSGFRTCGFPALVATAGAGTAVALVGLPWQPALGGAAEAALLLWLVLR